MRKESIYGILILLATCGAACQNQNKTSGTLSATFHFTAEPAPGWTALFKRNHGWFGGDGIFSAALSGLEKKGKENDDILIWFSDSLLGDIIDDSLQTDLTMINNSVALLKGEKPDSSAIHFFWNSTNSNAPASVFVPETPLSTAGEYYWLGDGFVNTEMNNDIFIFGYRIRNIPEKAVFGFKQTGNTLIRIPAHQKPPFPHKTQMDIPFFKGLDADSAGSFGAGVLVNTREAGVTNGDGYLYIYGVRGKQKEIIVARVKPSAIDQFDQWRFWNGKSWTNDINTISPIAAHASNEMSVSQLEDGRYIMVFQEDGLSSRIGIKLGASPVGPFGEMIAIYDAKDDLRDSPNLFSYNAKAHPVLSNPGELLISYNINSFDFNTDIKRNPHLYRPRFIKLKYE